MIPVPTTQRGQAVAIVAAAIAWVGLIIGEVLPGINQVTHGFTGYYGAAYAVLHGGAADLNDNSAFMTWVIRSGINGIQEVGAGGTPTLAWLMMPLAVFRPETAQTLWLFVNVGTLGICAWLAGRLCAPHNATARWWIVVIFALLAPVSETIQYGQVYLLLALLALITFMALLSHHDIQAGIAVGGMILIKPYYGVLSLGVLIWSRRPRSVVAAMAAVALVVIGSLPMLATAWPGFLPALASAIAVPSAGIPANQTLNSLTQHLFQYTPNWNPEPLIDLP